jgi:phenylpyruvate tautomerase PptA (4-oxalocrotonate tautomerase family)
MLVPSLHGNWLAALVLLDDPAKPFPIIRHTRPSASTRVIRHSGATGKSLLGQRLNSCFNHLMPLLKLETSVALPEDKRDTLLAALSKAVAGVTGKPEQYVMVTASQAAFLMSGKPGAAAFVDIRGIGGLTGSVNRKLSSEVCKLLGEVLGIPAQRVYLNFTELEAGNWGWNGNTFA